MRLSERAPTVSEAQLESVLNAVSDGIILTDEKGRILIFNSVCERLFGHTASEICGARLSTILPDVTDARHPVWSDTAARLSRFKSDGKSIEGRHRDGMAFPVAVSSGEISMPHGRQFTFIVRDLRPFLGIGPHGHRLSVPDDLALAHELNQPLTALLLYLQAAERVSLQNSLDYSLPSRAVEILEKAVHEAERAGHIIHRMRRFAEKREPVRRLLDVSLLIDDAIELTLLGFRSDIQVTCTVAPNLPPVLVDPVQIQQILVNLLRNALDAMRRRPAPKIRIFVARMADSVVVTVEDNGPGVPPETVPHLFEAFSSCKRTGLGLGLVISKAIAQSHGGDLTVDPGGNGRGAAFALHLPAPVAIAAPPLLAC